uniref:(northern house mosquito) hypothetical protein n=1 Tax=Culex pipiens TaxID=7175 RepID=A0A8D8DWY9_CULPI
MFNFFAKFFAPAFQFQTVTTIFSLFFAVKITLKNLSISLIGEPTFWFTTSEFLFHIQSRPRQLVLGSQQIQQQQQRKKKPTATTTTDRNGNMFQYRRVG